MGVGINELIHEGSSVFQAVFRSALYLPCKKLVDWRKLSFDGVRFKRFILDQGDHLLKKIRIFFAIKGQHGSNDANKVAAAFRVCLYS